MRWAWIPAAILGLMGLLILIAAEELINYICLLLLFSLAYYLLVDHYDENEIIPSK
jgi:NADH:ubiquinone oxidoreductase subunit 2 (subunit N)